MTGTQLEEMEKELRINAMRLRFNSSMLKARGEFGHSLEMLELATSLETAADSAQNFRVYLLTKGKHDERGKQGTESTV